MVVAGGRIFVTDGAATASGSTTRKIAEAAGEVKAGKNPDAILYDPARSRSTPSTTRRAP
jgi:hypothetical protein